MKLFHIIARGLIVVMGALTVAGAASAREPLPIDYWAVRPTMQSVSLSPTGEFVAYLVTESREGNPVLEVRRTADLSQTYRRIGGGRMELQSVQWISDNVLATIARRKVRDRIDGFNLGVYGNILQTYNVETEEFDEYDSNAFVVNVLPGDPDHIMIGVQQESAYIGEDDPFVEFRPVRYYRVNLETGDKELVIRGNRRIATAAFDDDGNPRFAVGYDAASREQVYYGRKPGETEWRVIHRLDSYAYERFGVAGFDPDDPAIFYVIAENGEDKASLWAFDIDRSEFLEKIYARSDVDVAGIVTSTAFWTNRSSDVAGFAYPGERMMTEWIDPSEEALEAQFRAAIPEAWNIGIQRSRDDSVLLISNSGPRDPGSYYMLINGQLSYLGGRYPLIAADDLSDVEYIHYQARDGRTIPAYLTVPAGDGPHPLIVLPHGGPFVGEIVGYDEWGQLLANNGYMVLQPQYRGSLGYGMDHFLSALEQNGLAMQDDKDDGVKYLVEQGRVDPNRVAMFGWSYGGYAALVAGIRTTEQLYQCTIAGAAVSDPNMQLNYYRDRLSPAQEEFSVRQRTGVTPVDDAADANIPMLIIHGDVDQRVPYQHARIMTRALREHDKEFEHIVLEGADHFSTTLFYEHKTLLYTSLLRYLTNDCGPGGL